MTTAISFGRFELRPASRELMEDGQPMPLGARAFDVLQALIERRERLVTKDELLDLAWPGVVVEENNLQVQISTLRRLLGPQSIATIPGRGYRFAIPLAIESGGGTLANAPTGGSTTRISSSLPERLPTLFGRADDLAALHELLPLHSLITIVGPGGIGKTRLAAGLADTCRHDATRALAWVDLAPLSETILIPATVAGTLGLPLPENRDPLETLIAALKKQSLLIVLDNCEHVVEAVAQLASALLAGTQDVRLLATSRTPLRVVGEQIYRLGPLAIPAVNASTQEAAKHGAVTLFVARARAIDRRFEISDKNVAVVIEVCTRLDGIPLAIELAAARLPLLGLRAISAMLDQRFRLLTTGSRSAPERHQTMLATFEWSHDLLSEVERIVFRRLGVFSGGFTLDAARTVARSEQCNQWQVVDVLGALIDHSLVVVDEGETPRYHLLDTARAFACQKLAEAGENGELQGRHAAYFCRFFDCAYDEWLTATDAEWRVKTEPEVDNLRAALNWSLQSDVDVVTGIALAGASFPIWLERDSHSRVEGRRYIQSAVGHLNATIAAGVEARLWLALGLLLPIDDADNILAASERAVALCRIVANDRELCHALLAYSRILTRKGRYRDAEAALGEAQVLLKQAPIARLQGLHSMMSGFHQKMTGHAHSADSHLKTALILFEKSGAENLALYTLNSLANRSWMLGDLDGAVSGFREAVVRARRSRSFDEDLIGLPLSNLAAVLIEQGNLEQATPVALEALGLLHQAERAWGLFDALALRLVLLGKHEDAARLEGFVSATYEAGSQRREPNEERLHARLLALLGERFSKGDLNNLVSAGAKLSADEARRIAL